MSQLKKNVDARIFSQRLKSESGCSQAVFTELNILIFCAFMSSEFIIGGRATQSMFVLVFHIVYSQFNSLLQLDNPV